MFLGIIFVEKHPVLFDVHGVHDNFCQDCSNANKSNKQIRTN